MWWDFIKSDQRCSSDFAKILVSIAEILAESDEEGKGGNAEDKM